MGSAFSQQQYVVAKPPTGRLTLVTGEPVMSSEQANKQNVYYTPYTGSMLPIYDGTGWRERTFSELTLALAGSANWASGSNYDLFVYDDAGTLRLLTGPAWTNDTTRATALERVNGLLMNAASMTGRYGASSTVTVAQDRGLYVGTMRTNASGQTTWQVNPGEGASGTQACYGYLWNMYNRVWTGLIMRPSAATWSYHGGTRQWNGDSGMKLEVVTGEAQSFVVIGVGSTQPSGGGLQRIGYWGGHSRCVHQWLSVCVQLHDLSFHHDARGSIRSSAGATHIQRGGIHWGHYDCLRVGELDDYGRRIFLKGTLCKLSTSQAQFIKPSQPFAPSTG